VISRVWSGWAATELADEYDRHYRDEVLAELRQVPGFRGARLLRRAVGDQTEFVSVTFFEDLDAVRAFAGEDYERANVAESARKVLSRYDQRVRHYATVVEV
jgi:heme-degrading monooxygenase HmoA